MELVAGHVEIGQVVVLLLDLDIAVGEILVLFLDFAEAQLDAAVLLGELLDLLAQALGLLVRCTLVLGLERRHAVPETLIVPQQFLGEFLTLVEQLEKLLSFLFFAHREVGARLRRLAQS